MLMWVVRIEVYSCSRAWFPGDSIQFPVKTQEYCNSYIDHQFVVFCVQCTELLSTWANVFYKSIFVITLMSVYRCFLWSWCVVMLPIEAQWFYFLPVSFLPLVTPWLFLSLFSSASLHDNGEFHACCSWKLSDSTDDLLQMILLNIYYEFLPNPSYFTIFIFN